MSAADHLQPQQFYHGTPHEFSAGEMIEPRSAGLAFATDDAGAAHDWGQLKARGAPAYTYEVEPTGEMHHMFGQGTMYSTKHPMRVVRQIPDEDNPGRS